MIKKLGCLSVMFILALSINAQEVVQTDKLECKKPCTPTKECAEKYGMTLEECKRICATKNAQAAYQTETSTTVANSEASTKVASYQVKKVGVAATEEKTKACSKKKMCCKKSKKEKA